MDDTFLERLLKMAFTPVGTFTAGATLTDARQTLLWEVSQGGDGHYYSWSGTFPKAVTAGSSPSPIEAGSWVDRTDDSLRDEIRETVFQNMKRQASEAGFNLVDGSFEEGANISGWPDVVWCQALGIYLQWHLDEAKTVAAGSTPTNIGTDWIDKSSDPINTDNVSFKFSNVATAVSQSITDFLTQSFVHVDWCGAVGDGVTDDWQSIVNANNVAFTLGIRCVKFGQKTYRSSKCFNIKEQVTWFSDCGFQSGASKAKIQFDDNTCGIIIHRSNTNADDYGYNNIKEVSPTSGGADGSIIRGLSIVRGNGSYTTIDDISHGIRMRARASIENCYISGFAGNGIHIIAQSGGTDESEGNANNWEVSNTRCQNCRDGVFVDGPDVNVGMAFHLDCSSNARYGIYDSSFLGCNWFGCHCNGNGVLDILQDSNNAKSVFIGQYVESGGAITFIKPCYVIGGQFSGVTITGTYYSLDKLPDFTVEYGYFNKAVTGTARNLQVWNQGSASVSRAATVSFFSGLVESHMPTGAVKARPSASNITNRSIIGFEVYDGSTRLYETAMDCRGNTYDIVPGGDASWDLGDATLRFNNIFAANGTINTSDEREKTFSEIEDSEIAAALEIKAQIKKFKFNDAIENKGLDKARWHFGVGAQTVKAIMESHGLDAFSYGFLCYDTWGDEYEDIVDEDGNVTGNKVVREAGDRYGVRYEELAMFMLSAI